MGLLERISAWDPKEIAARPEIKELWRKGLFWCLAHRRSFKYPMGIKLPQDAFFEYEPRDLVPISDEEIAILCWAAAGTNGIIRNDLSYIQGATIHPWFEGRVYPSACNVWYVHLIFCTDDGIYRYVPHVPAQPVEIQGEEDLWKIFQAFKDGVRQISNQPIRIPEQSPAAWKLTAPFIFKPGTVMFIPVADLTTEYINLIFYLSDAERYIFIDDIKGEGRPAGIEKWVKSGYLNGVKAPLTMIETVVPPVIYSSAAFMIQNLQLAQAAMGLGGYPLGGYQSIIVMGATPVMRGLGFRFNLDKRGVPYPVGIDGHVHGHLPPYMDLDAAVEDLWNVRYQPGYGRYSPDVPDGAKVKYPGFDPEPREVYRPFKDVDKYLQTAIKQSPEAVEIAKAAVHYIWDTYGRLPALADSFIAPNIVQISHVDVKFYEKYSKEGSVWDEHYRHFEVWHRG